LRAAFLSGLLQTTTDRRVSAVNAESIAHEMGIALHVRSDESAGAYAASLDVSCGPRNVTATASSSGARIVGIDGFEVDAVPSGTLIVTRHRDVPGMIGGVGTILGNAQANVSTMQVARDERGALMILSVDRALGRTTLLELQALPDMQRVETLSV
jgi:D-3-phosphoglycerate dehydrogenase